MPTRSASFSVLVVGGGIVGLTSAAFLAQAGVRVILVERRSHPSRRLRAKFFYPRTVELYRSLGLEAKIAGTNPASAPNEAMSPMPVDFRYCSASLAVPRGSRE